MDVVKAAQLSGRTLERVVVHPLVLLSIVDHYNRVARDTRKRVVGVLLGTSSRGSVDVTNSYAGKPPNNPRLLFLCPSLGFVPLGVHASGHGWGCCAA
jgi:26S proteasome regulatory subunit N8